MTNAEVLDMIESLAGQRNELLSKVDELRQFIGELYQVGHDQGIAVTRMAGAAGVRRETVHYWLRNSSNEEAQGE